MVRAFDDLARQRGQSLAALALSWVLRLRAVTSALIGASSVEQLETNCKALDRLNFSPEELQEIEAILKPA